MAADAIAPVIETERLRLRGHQVEDFADSATMWGDPRVVEHITGQPASEEQTWARLLRYVGHWHVLGFGYWVVCDKADGRFLGEVGFANFRRDTTPSLHGKPEAGWAFRVEAQGRGLAREAVTAMHDWADAHLVCNTTVAMIAPKNAASIRLAEAVGYANPVPGRHGDETLVFVERPRGST